MSNDTQVIVKKRGFGAFLLGFLFGFIFVFVAVAGVGFYAYKKVSIKNIEGLTGVNVPVNEELKTQPLEKIIGLAIDLAKDSSSLSLSKIEETFGVVVSLTGNSIPVGVKHSGSGYVFAYSTSELDDTYLDISVFSSINVSSLASEVRDFVTNISLLDLQKLASFTLPDIPLINEVKTQPLMDALQTISEKLNFSTLTLRDLNDEFGVDLSSVDALKDFMDIPFNGEGNNNLAYAINNATVGNFVGLAKLDSETEGEYKYRLQEAGIIGSIAEYKINELQTKFNTLTLGKVMGLERKYVRTGTPGNYSYALETEIAYNSRLQDAKLLGALKDAKINELQDAIENLDIAHRNLSQLEEWGLVDLSELTQADKERISSRTIKQIIEEYANLGI